MLHGEVLIMWKYTAFTRLQGNTLSQCQILWKIVLLLIQIKFVSTNLELVFPTSSQWSIFGSQNIFFWWNMHLAIGLCPSLLQTGLRNAVLPQLVPDNYDYIKMGIICIW